MTTKNKKPKKERIESDFYSTPHTASFSLFHAAPWLLDLTFKKTFFEPAFGEGAIPKALWIYMNCFEISIRNAPNWWGVDIVERDVDCLTRPDIFWCQDFVKDPPVLGRKDGLITITNPSFPLACDYIDICRQITSTTIMLLPLGFLGSQERTDWWQVNIPDQILVLSERPKFAHNGTDRMDYAWYIWDSPVPIAAQDRIKILPPWADIAEKEYLCQLPAKQKKCKRRSPKSKELYLPKRGLNSWLNWDAWRDVAVKGFLEKTFSEGLDCVRQGLDSNLIYRQELNAPPKPLVQFSPNLPPQDQNWNQHFMHLTT